MESLKHTFAENIQRLENNTANLPPPTPDQIGNFLRRINADVGSVIRTCPAEVQRLVRRKFNDIGFDCRTNRGFKPTPPSVDEIKAFLASTLEGLNTVPVARAATSTTITISQEELDDLSKACNKLWELDANRLVPGRDYELDLQQGKKIYQEFDAAAGPLFARVDAAALARPTYAAFRALLDNYERGTGEAEVVTNHELAENRHFIDLIMATGPMRYCHAYLARKGKAPAQAAAFKQTLSDLWFTLYRRETQNDSSGFEHVFVGESKHGEITGLHNWIQMYLEEQRGSFDYQGYIYPRVRGGRNGFRHPLSSEQLISLQFTWDGELKKCSSSFIGTSPEFEMALLTLCFLAGEQENVVQCGPYSALITCYKMHVRGKMLIGSAFPSEAPLSDKDAAVKIQAAARGQQCRRQGARAYQDTRDRHRAASTIQAGYRGSRTRKSGS